MNYEEIQGDLIKLAKKGEFDVIAHGCNCFCRQKSGLATQMVKGFGTDFTVRYPHEGPPYMGDINKLGTIEYYLNRGLYVANMYTQFYHTDNCPDDTIPFDRVALRMCLKKLNYKFKGKHIGLPKISCGEAKGDWLLVKNIIREEMIDCKVTIVIHD